jgi:hypothetical protein
MFSSFFIPKRFITHLTYQTDKKKTSKIVMKRVREGDSHL